MISPEDWRRSKAAFALFSPKMVPLPKSPADEEASVLPSAKELDNGKCAVIASCACAATASDAGGGGDVGDLSGAEDMVDGDFETALQPPPIVPAGGEARCVRRGRKRFGPGQGPLVSCVCCCEKVHEGDAQTQGGRGTPSYKCNPCHSATRRLEDFLLMIERSNSRHFTKPVF